MPDYVLDSDADVWDRRDDGWHWGGLVRSWEYLRDHYAPLTPCDADGEPLNPTSAGDARQLVADAFADLAQRMRAYPQFSMAQSIPDGMRSQMAEWVAEWADETSAGLCL